MQRLLVFFALLALSVLAAGLFGMAHNQLSYSIGPSYFHDFKFTQFNIPPDTAPRWGAAVVGWRASWWMGLLIGAPVCLLGFVLLRRVGVYAATGVAAIGTVIGVTVLAALLGVALGLLSPGDVLDQVVPVPDGISGALGFQRAAILHEASYLGGGLGLIAALWVVWRARRVP